MYIYIFIEIVQSDKLINIEKQRLRPTLRQKGK